MSRITFLTVTSLLTGLASAPALADSDVKREMKEDVLLRALVDEVERGKVGLKLEDLERPYFIEYALQDSTRASVSAVFGAVTGRNETRARFLRTDVRVGSYKLDNTNYSGDLGGFSFPGFGGGRFGGAAIPVEDDYNAIRQAIWWATDRDYKSVTESFEKKKAFMESKVIEEDKPDDFSQVSPTVHFEDRQEVKIDLGRLEKIVTSLSAIFRAYPEVQSSAVRINGNGGNTYLVNTEGTRFRTSGASYSLSIDATVQADDGMKLSDSVSIHVRDLDDLPSIPELSKRCRDLVVQLVDVKNAPKLESYSGPVLVDAEVAATLFSNQFARRFAGGQRPLGGRTPPNDFEEKLGKRILPKFLNVVDDPTLEEIDGVPVMAHYKFDHQGVEVKPVTLVEKGRLKALVMSRNPSKKFKASTGHGRGMFRPRASVGCLKVTTSKGTTNKELKEKLTELLDDDDLEYGIRIASLGASSNSRFQRFTGMFGDMGRGFGRSRGASPLAIYKVYPDGREELVRGAELARIGLRAFKRIKAAGDQLHVLNTGGRGGRTVAAPALLFEELDVGKIDRDFDKPPILPSPFARTSKES
ncbi:MAG: metallopeptidase TldD-related protein [Phycisphaerales bacterium]|nr:metallopeptidase TldD-related protein [Phycisphaerales bacterium]